MTAHLCIGRQPRASRPATPAITLVAHRPLWQRAALWIASPFTTCAVLGVVAGIVAAVFVLAH